MCVNIYPHEQDVPLPEMTWERYDVSAEYSIFVTCPHLNNILAPTLSFIN